tara:strand:- start:1921 stop:3279 length:1359 start_codon:yes stop_codon:yes gene_type:complete
MKPDFIILAAGKGQRMLGNQPKVLHEVGGIPMAQRLLNTIHEIKNSKTIVVIGDQSQKVKNRLKVSKKTAWVKQKNQLGTAHAVKTALSQTRPGSIVVVLYGDVPLVQSKTLNKLLKLASNKSLAAITFKAENPRGYGRIIRSSRNQVEAIIEEKDASKAQRNIQEVNSGMLALHSSVLKKLLPVIKNKNAAGEYYLTDVVGLARKSGISIKPLLLENPSEALGANTPEELQELERACQRQQALRLVGAGIQVADINRIDVRGSLSAGKGSFIDVNNVFEGSVVLGKEVKVGPNCFIKDSVIEDRVTLKANTVIEDSRVGKGCILGPFTRVRGGTTLESSSELGNFVEANRSKVGRSSKAKHLTYLGDATLGEQVNVGAGTITCNYDGIKKHKTKMADNVFIGSNTSLVAPVSLGEGSYTGAGSVITKSVPKESLAIGRARQSPPIKRKKKK